MISLLLVVILNVFILILFRLLSQFLVNTFQTIVINYWTCVVIGLIISGGIQIATPEGLKSWIWFALLLGGVFVITFSLIARTSQVFDVSIASLSSKVSLAMPVFFSLVIFQSFLRTFDWLNYLGLFLTFAAIITSSLKKELDLVIPRNKHFVVLPISVFFLSGIIDTSLNYATLKLISSEESLDFTIVVFFSAALLGTIAFVFGKKKFESGSIPWGVTLGVINVFTIVLLLSTLRYFNNDGAFVFPLVNIGIIIFATVASGFIFKEKWNKFKVMGIGFGILALLLIAHQEIFPFLK